MPPGVTTLATIRTTARQESDMVNSQFITDAEFNSYINASYQELYGMVVQKFGDDYYFNSSTFTTDGTNNAFALPADFFKLLGVDLQLPGIPGRNITLHPFNFTERNRYFFTSPIPQAGLLINLLYVPRLTILVADGDTADGVNGWEEYLVIDAALKAKDKEESDTSVLQARKAAIIQRLEAEAENRDAGRPASVVDAQANDYGYGWPGSYFPGWSSFGLTSLKYRLRGSNILLIPVYGGGLGI